ncbi:MAG: PEP-CTERM sorting domain-containing protein [Phycisphaerae bacterium]|nr:PEP-CTERM sorting domain-containing protein [Phycisphaerae bacterium]
MRATGITFFVVMATVMALSAVQTASADWTQQDKVTATGATAGDHFGSSVSISGGYAVVGAYELNGSDSGSAYIYERNGTAWSQQAKLTVSAAAGIQFGYSVSIGGDYAIVGARGDNSWTGSAYIFKRDGITWTQQAKLTASDAATDDWFGHSVSINGDYAVVGANYADNGGDRFGSAYVFKRDGITWTQQGKLTASDAAIGNLFGESVSISGDNIVVGANHDAGTAKIGSAYIFEKPVSGGWVDMTQTAKLTASDAADGDLFGTSVSIDGDHVIVGAYGNDDGGSSTGSAYIFEKPVSGWADTTEAAKLTASDATAGDWFGLSVSISGDSAVVGAHGSDASGSWSGSAYAFEKPVSGGWANMTETAKLIASDAAAYDTFGYSVAIDNKCAIVGATGDNSGGGSAYIFIPEPATLVMLTLGSLVVLRRRRFDSDHHRRK